MKPNKRTAGGRSRLRTFFHDAVTHVSMVALVLSAFIQLSPAPAAAMQILDAVDHAELEAEISDRAVSRIALAGDRIARVIRGPDGFVVEHDAARGDLYLRPADPSGGRVGGAPRREPLTLFIGTAAGFTYRLALTVAERGSAQVLIRNAAAVTEAELPRPSAPRVGALVGLIRAVARRGALPGYSIETLPETDDGEGLATIEIWRGREFTVRVLEAEAGPESDAETLARRLAPETAAIWLAPPGTGPSGGRLVVAVADASRLGPAGVER